MEFFYGTTAAAIESMYCQLLQEKRAIHAHRDVLAWNQNIRFEKKSSSISMTQLLTHTVAHSTIPSFRPKPKNQPIKKNLSLAVTWVRIVKMCKILAFKANFLFQKWSESF